jgi:hypothetical protein
MSSRSSAARWPTQAAQSRLAHWDQRSAVLMLMPVRPASTEAGSSAARARQAVLRPAWGDAVAVETDAEQDAYGRAGRALAGEEPRHGSSQPAESPSWLVLVT